jgi:tubulin beta
LEYYNALLAVRRLYEDGDMTHFFDNEALHCISYRTQGLMNPTIEDINHQVSLVMSRLTTCFRFLGLPMGSLRQFVYGMVPLKEFRFLMPSFAPLTTRGSQQYPALTIPELGKHI